MNASQVHAMLVECCGGIVTRYRDDLLVHDLNTIDQIGPHTPFLHFCRDSGTYMVGLIAADEYPAKGQHVPFLFGSADREKLLDGAVTLATHCSNPVNGTHICHYFNGKTIKRITLVQALTIATEYARTIRATWAKGYDQQPVDRYVALGM